MTNPYLELTEAFNRGRLRAILSSGQADLISWRSPVASGVVHVPEFPR